MIRGSIIIWGSENIKWAIVRVKKMNLGIAGDHCSGKDSAAKYLASKGFVHISLSDFLRVEAAKRGKEPVRQVLIDLGNELRQSKGYGVLAQLATAQMKQGTRYVITSIMNPAEVDVLRKYGPFELIWLDAPLSVCWERMQATQRTHNMHTFEEYLRKREEQRSASAHHQQMHLVEKAADVRVASSDFNKMCRGLDSVCSNLKIMLR